MKVATNSIILTFETAVLPEKIKVGYLVVRVKPFIPSPLRCFQCQRYGHGIDRCRGKVTCSRCAGEHDSDGCSEQPHCVHCDENHPTTDRNCPKFKFEKEVQRIKFTENISYPEARKKASNSTANTPNNYAKAVNNKPTVTSIGTQTTITWPFNEKSYSSINETEIAAHSSKTETISHSSQTETVIDSQSTDKAPAQKPPAQKPPLSSRSGNSSTSNASTSNSSKPTPKYDRSKNVPPKERTIPGNKSQNRFTSSQKDMDTNSSRTKGSLGGQTKIPTPSSRDRSRSPILYEKR